MRQTTAVLVASVLNIGAGGSLLARDLTPFNFAAAGSGLPLFQLLNGEDAAITRAFRSVLRRDPYPTELRRYRLLMEENGWRESDVLRDLRGRPDYQRYSPARRGVSPDAIVRRAYQDILGRDPDPEGLRNYRSKIIDQGWSERDVREALRTSDEYVSGDARSASADRIIRRAYQDILGREPDPSGLQTYRRNIVENGWDEHDVRQALLRSPEKQQLRQGVGDDAAAAIVRRAYLGVLNREPDANGLRDYKLRVLRDHWSEQDVARALRNSDEYRSTHR